MHVLYNRIILFYFNVISKLNVPFLLFIYLDLNLILLKVLRTALLIEIEK